MLVLYPQDYIEDNDKLALLHDQIHECDIILSQIGSLLSGFQVGEVQYCVDIQNMGIFVTVNMHKCFIFLQRSCGDHVVFAYDIWQIFHILLYWGFTPSEPDNLAFTWSYRIDIFVYNLLHSIAVILWFHWLLGQNIRNHLTKVVKVFVTFCKPNHYVFSNQEQKSNY